MLIPSVRCMHSLRLNSLHHHGKVLSSVSFINPHKHHTDCSLLYTQKRHASQSFADKYLSPDFLPIRCAQQFLENVHDVTGLPWWASIAISTFALRTVVTLPLAVFSARVMNRVELLQPEIQQLSSELKGEVASAIKHYKWDQTLANHHYKRNVSYFLHHIVFVFVAGITITLY